LEPRPRHVQHGGLLVRVGTFNCPQEAFGGVMEMLFCIHGNTHS
jgi:hypothetical protein